MNDYIKYKKIKYDTYNGKQIFDFIKYIIKKKGLIIHGGTSIDTILKHVTNGEIQLYDDYIIPDIDVFSNNPINDSETIAYKLKSYGFEYITVKSGIYRDVRKIWVNFYPDAILDISRLKYPIDTITILGIKYEHPVYTLLNAYKNITMNIYKDYYRFDKSINKIIYIEEYLRKEIDNFNFQKTNIIKIIDKKKDPLTIEELYKITDNGDFILAGDIILHKINMKTEIRNAIILTNQLNDINILYKGNNVLILPLIGETFCIPKKLDKQKKHTINIATNTLSIYIYYYMYIYIKNDKKYLDEIRKLILNVDTWEYYNNPHIYKPKIKEIKKIKNENNNVYVKNIYI